MHSIRHFRSYYNSEIMQMFSAEQNCLLNFESWLVWLKAKSFLGYYSVLQGFFGYQTTERLVASFTVNRPLKRVGLITFDRHFCNIIVFHSRDSRLPW